MENPESGDAQDIAEVFDEDNLDSDARRLARDDEELNFDDMPDVYDATRAAGDEDDEEGLIGEDLDDADLVELVAGEQDEGEEEDEDDLHSAAGVSDDDEEEGEDEVELTYSGDLNEAAGAHSAAQRYESRTLSDADLEELGYAEPQKAGEPRGAAEGEPTGGAGGSAGEARSFNPDSAAAAPRRTDEERLDEAVEETFPASDPIAPSHIS